MNATSSATEGGAEQNVIQVSMIQHFLLMKSYCTSACRDGIYVNRVTEVMDLEVQ